MTMTNESIHRSWVTSHTECPNCHYKFNFRHSKWGSASAVRVGPNWTFVCPNCRTKQSFLIKKGEEDGLPLIMDQSLSPFLIGHYQAQLDFLQSSLHFILGPLEAQFLVCSSTASRFRLLSMLCICSILDLLQDPPEVPT